jgi:3-hydroxyacyl-CoA dehydrogenase
MNTNLNTDISHDDIAVMVDKLKKKREFGRLRAQKWYDLHKDALKQERLKIKLEKQEQKKTIEINKKEEEKREPKKRGRKIKDVDVSDVINKLIQI